ncbi:MAG: DUF898 family protein, partial [Deltaproteobacteria bacterium]
LTGEVVKDGAPPASAGAPAPFADTPTAAIDYRLEFRGTAREYFGIWIVNMLLKIVTLGFYTAWAKVRQRRYFAGSTLLAGEPFEYLAEPGALFRGWLIAVAAGVQAAAVVAAGEEIGDVFGLDVDVAL